jgi:transposase
MPAIKRASYAMVVAESGATPGPVGPAGGGAIEIEFCRRGSDADHGHGRHGDAEGRSRGAGRWTAAVIPIPSGVRVWIATGHTDMRRGMNSLALLVQEAFKRDPHGGDLYVFRGKSGKLIKILWHDGLGMSLYAKRLERGRVLWPSSVDGVVTITPAHA